jgi:ABC-type antimicrobial peptide transport system permease subunit
MSLEFAIKDLLHFGTQSKVYLRSAIMVNIFAILFLNLTKSLGVLYVASPVTLYTYTIVEIFSQYNLFLLAMAFILAGVVIFSLNHSLIMHRRKDISIMQAVGTYPQQLYSYYILEMLVLVSLSWILGAIGGFIIFVLIFISLEASVPTLTWQPDFIITIILFFLLIGITFFINGWEIRKIGQTSYVKNKMGMMDSKGIFKLRSELRQFLAKRSISFRLAFYHISRLRIEFRQTVALIAIAGSILLTGFFGSMMIYNTTTTYIQEGEGQYILAIGATPIVSSVQIGYERFSNASTPELPDADYLNATYNLTSFAGNLAPLLQTYRIEKWEQRLFTTTLIQEKKGFVFNPQVTNVTDLPIDIGAGNQTRVVPIQGVVYGNTITNWYYEGALMNILGGAVVGDTLGAELFENAYLQSVAFKNIDQNITYHYKVNAVVVDPFNNGNVAYFVLSELQGSMDKNNYTNLILIDYSPTLVSGNYEAFIQEIKTQLSTDLGEGFEIIDLAPIFKTNENTLGIFQWIAFIMSGIMGILIIYVLVNFQLRQIDEQQRDYFIMRSVGAKKGITSQKIFFEQCMLILLGIAIAFIISLFIIEFLLMENQIFPSVWVPIGITGAIIGILVLAASLMAYFLTKQIYMKAIQQEIRV